MIHLLLMLYILCYFVQFNNVLLRKLNLRNRIVVRLRLECIIPEGIMLHWTKVIVIYYFMLPCS
jgi:multisubunit Na+/H+ antiporter MnhB subunit